MNGETKKVKIFYPDSCCVVCGSYVAEGSCVCRECLSVCGFPHTDLSNAQLQWLRDVCAESLKKERAKDAMFKMKNTEARRKNKREFR